MSREITPETLNSYSYQRAKDLRDLRELYRRHKSIEYYGKGWIKIGGIVINGIDRKDIERIEREINQQN